MPILTIRNLDDDVIERLQQQATRNGVSIEDEARRILSQALRPQNALEAWRACEPPGWRGVELSPPPREPDRPAPEFD